MRTSLVQFSFSINELHFSGAIMTNKAVPPSFETRPVYIKPAFVSSDTVSINGNNLRQSHLSEVEGTLLL